MLITVKTYPVITGHGEAACIAGLERLQDESLRWARLFPVPFRELEEAAKFKLWQWVTVRAKRTAKDQRPETWLPDAGSIRVGEHLGTDKGSWRRRMEMLEPLLAESMCDVLGRQEIDGTSLGGFRPDPGEVEVYAVENDPWSEKTQSRSQQASLFQPDLPSLEWIPWRFKAKYNCGGACPGHDQGIYDWGLLQLYRKQRRIKGEAGARDDVLGRLRTIVASSNDLVLFVGNQHRGPRSFMVIGWAHPKRAIAPSEGDGYQLGFEGL